MPSIEQELFDAIGHFGRWQYVVFGIFFYTNIAGIWQSYAMTFLTPNVPFRCIEPFTNATYADEEWPMQCSVSLPNTSEEMPCTKWEYDTAKYSDTLVSEWDLVCGREWLVSFAKSVYMIGFMASVFVFGQISDWIGRRPTIMIGFVLTCIGLILCLFSTSIEAFLIYRFLLAFGRTGFTTVGFVLIMEIVGPRHRMFISLVIQVGWTVGFIVLALIGYFFRHWFWFMVAITVPVLPVAALLIFIPESPRWLLMHARKEQLKKLINTASKTNRIKLKEDTDDIIKRLFKSHVEEKKGTLLDLFRTPNLRSRTFVAMYLWLVNAFMYYALSYNTNDLSGDPYINFLLLGILEFPAYGLLYLLMRFWGRRTITVALMILSGVLCLALVAVPADLPSLVNVLSQAGKFCVTASFGLLYMYTGEIFPTLVRSAALGSCSTVARIGSIVAPFSREMGKATHPVVPNVILTVLSVSSGLFSLWLPETAGRKLPDTLEEGENEFEMKE